MAFLVTSTTVILAGALAGGVYNMALSEQAARQTAQNELVVRDVSTRLQASFRALRTLAERDVIDGDDDRALGRALASAYIDNAEYLRGLALLDLDDETLVRYPQDQDTPSADQVRRADMSEGVAYIWSGSTSEGPSSLWVAVPTKRANGHRSVLLGTVRTGFIDEVLKQVSFSSRKPTAGIVDASGSIVLAAGDPQAYLESSATYEPSAEDPSHGSVVITSSSGQVFSGVFAEIPGLAGLDWRVVVAEADDVVVSEIWNALRPAVVAWSASSTVALLLALVTSFVFLARPLRLLDVRARAAASGAVLEPLPVKRSDEVGRLIESFNSIGQRLRRMQDMSQLLASSADLDEVLDRIVASLAHILDARDIDILLLEDDGQYLALARATGQLEQSVGERIDPSKSEWLSGVIATKEVGDLSDLEMSDPLAVMHTVDDSVPCALAVPLIKGTEVLGIVAIFHEPERAFSDAEKELARSFAAQASVALDNARLFDDERRSRRDAEALRRVAEIMGGSGTLRDSLTAIARIEAELLDADRSWVFLDGGRGLRGESEDDSESAWFSLWNRLGEERVTSDSGALLSLTTDDEDDGVRELLARLDVTAALVSPVMVGDSLAGLVVLGWREHAFVLDKRARGISSAIGKQVALALENAMLFDEARSRADNLETIFRISQAVSSSLQSRVVLNRVLDVVQKILSADAVMLMTLEADRSLMVVPMARGIINPEMLQMEFRAGVDLPGRVFEEKQPISVPDLSLSDSRLAQVSHSQGLGSAVLVPLLARGRSIGVLAVFSQSKAAFTAEEIELLSTFATQAALAIDTAALFSREHHVATVLQQSILPTRLPVIEGIESSSVYVPAGNEVEIGGDYYDLFMAPDGRVTLAIGDVCGKGVEAATKTSMIKYSIRGMVAAGATPSAVLGELNEALVSAGDPSDIVTLWLGLLDIRTGKLTWANGGHPPAMLLQPSDGEIVRLGTTGALLGAIKSASYSESEVIVELGGSILMYTDGVTEARNRGRFFGEGRIRRSLRQGGSPTVVTQRVLSQVQRFSQGGLRDDVAILTVRFGGEASEGMKGVSKD